MSNIEWGETCQQCGKKYQMAYWVPDEDWETIKPEESEAGGLLCLSCADTRARAKDIVLRWQASTGWWLGEPQQETPGVEKP